MPFLSVKTPRDERVIYARCDAEDYEALSRHSWYLDHGGYVVRTCKESPRRGSIQMGRDVLGLKRGHPLHADHISHNKLDNRRRNLRRATVGQNNQNRRGAQTNSKSGVRGVSWAKHAGKWLANIQIDGRNRNLGYYDTKTEAGEVAAKARAELMPFSEEARNGN